MSNESSERILTFTHLTPLSVAEVIQGFTEPSDLMTWLCDFAEKNQEGNLTLAWGQNHYVVWKASVDQPRATIEITQWFMGDQSLETKIGVKLTAQGTKTFVEVCQSGNISPKMEEEYRYDWIGLQYLGFPKRP